ncbi:helix-turn-helix transcriptional regulator [Ferruginibacter sp.]
MQLVEREEFLASLHQCFENVLEGEGHSMFVCGESGIGKTSLVKQFCRTVNKRATILLGTCDALFAPRPLGPLYDVLLQLKKDWTGYNETITDRTAFFAQLFLELKAHPHPVIILFEDIHWADEATLDFIKFLARRITQLPCVFLLTYRDNEIDARHPLRTVLGQLIPGSYSRIVLPHLSKEAVEQMAESRGYNGEEVYKISGGNPFYVQEMLASYNLGVPENIRDSILAAYSRCDEKAKLVWDLLSVQPSGFELEYLEQLDAAYPDVVGTFIEHRILIVEEQRLFFKHELFRRTIESSLSPFLRISLHKMILERFRQSFETRHQVERIIHHAKNANEYELVVQYAPEAAKKAAALGAHIEAAKLYLTAIEYYNKQDKEVLVTFYEAYAYECYLTNQVKEAIIYNGKALDIWKEKGSITETGNCLRFLSRLWWFDGNRTKAEQYAKEAVDVLENEPSTKAKAMAYSNMSQLMMLADLTKPCEYWGSKAIEMAKELNDEETLLHALNNVGTTLIMTPLTMEKGTAMLQQSLDLALANGFHEHAARAYTNMGSAPVKLKDYTFAERVLTEGIKYCEERDLNSWSTYMLSWKARVYAETGKWQDAIEICDTLLAMHTSPIVKISVLIAAGMIKMRRGEEGALALLLEAKKLAFDTNEAQRLLPVLAALLEYEWLTGEIYIEQKEIDTLIALIRESDAVVDNSNFIFWLQKARGVAVKGIRIYEGYQVDNKAAAKKAAAIWEKTGAPYEQSLALFEGTEEQKRTAVSMVHELGAVATSEKLKQLMRNSGIKNIPRGIRKSTQANAAHLTQREIDIVTLLKDGLQNKEIASKLFISPKTVDHHISSLLFKLDVNSRTKAAQEATRLGIIK